MYIIVRSDNEFLLDPNTHDFGSRLEDAHQFYDGQKADDLAAELKARYPDFDFTPTDDEARWI